MICSDNGQKAPANAWARPLQQASTTTTTKPPPGMAPLSNTTAPAIDSASASINRERFLHLNLTLVGQKVTLTQTDGTVLEGVLHTFTPFTGLSAEQSNKYVLKATKVVKSGSNTPSFEAGATVVLSASQVLSMKSRSVNLTRQSSNVSTGSGAVGKGVMTDTEISKGRAAGNRELVSAGSAWTSGGKNSRAEALAGGLDDKKKAAAGQLGGSIGQWDQFKANQELFNVNATYDENLYTTELDKSQIDKKKIAEAERLAREIEGTTSSNLHIAEERGHVVETDYDEEDRYSGVLTKDGKNRHEVDGPKPTAAVQPPKMNFAAAAAKAVPAKKASPPGLVGKAAEAETKDNNTAAAPDSKAEDTKEKPKESDADASKPDESAKSDEANEKKEEKVETDTKKEETSDAPKEKPKSKLNANAKSFTFNPSAKSFTPSFSAPPAQPDPSQQQQMDPNAHMMHGHPMQAPPYMPNGQPGKDIEESRRKHSCSIHFEL